jgi:hypothetical protein
LLFGAAFGAAPLPLPSFRRFGGRASSGMAPVVHMTGAALGRVLFDCTGFALGFARALVGLGGAGGAADGAGTSSIRSSPAMDGFGGATSGSSGVGTVGAGAADGLAFALTLGGALLVRGRLGAEYYTMAAGAVGAGLCAGAGSAAAAPAAGGGGGGCAGAGALS